MEYGCIGLLTICSPGSTAPIKIRPITCLLLSLKLKPTGTTSHDIV
jgi:hypothetical protein